MATPWFKWLTGGYPSPIPIADIKPELRVFRRGKQSITINHDANPATIMDSKGFLDVQN